MPTVTLEEAGTNLRGIIQRAIRDKEETMIASDEGAVVVLAEQECRWSNISESGLLTVFITHNELRLVR